MSTPDPGIPGIKLVAGVKCPKCGGPVFRKACPCPFTRSGWQTCGRCFNPACATVVGVKRRPGWRPRRGPFRLGR